MKVLPGEEINARMIDTYFSEDYRILIFLFEDRSKKLIFDFIEGIAALVRLNPSIERVYFHNFSRFDGIILLKHLACHHKNDFLKALMRNKQ